MRLRDNYQIALALICLISLWEGNAFAKKSQISKRIKVCYQLYDNMVRYYQGLFDQLPPSVKANPPINAATKLMTVKRDDCSRKSSARQLLSLIVKALAYHNRKIGVLLPNGGDTKHSAEAVLEGMKAALGPDIFSRQVIVKNTLGQLVHLQRALAELVFIENISIIIGGATKAEATHLLPYAGRLMLPILIMSQRLPSYKYNRNAFYVFPNLNTLVEKIVNHAISQNYQKIALLLPSQSSSSKLVDLLALRFKEAGIDANMQFFYTPNDYPSMELAAKKIFKIDPGERAEELAEIVKRAKERAQKNKEKFNPNLISLPPIIDVDAIFIPDNFRTVRHFAKIFQYLGVKKINLIGNQKWRAFGLIQPPEPFLEGAVFVDYIGSYENIPRGIKVQEIIGASKYFVSPTETFKVDYMIIGYHAIDLATKALQGKMLKRRHLNKKLRRIHNRNSRYFENGRAFDKRGNAKWPAFLFRVTDQDIVLL